MEWTRCGAKRATGAAVVAHAAAVHVWSSPGQPSSLVLGIISTGLPVHEYQSLWENRERVVFARLAHTPAWRTRHTLHTSHLHTHGTSLVLLPPHVTSSGRAPLSCDKSHQPALPPLHALAPAVGRGSSHAWCSEHKAHPTRALLRPKEHTSAHLHHRELLLALDAKAGVGLKCHACPPTRAYRGLALSCEDSDHKPSLLLH